MMTEGVVLGHIVFDRGIQVDRAKVQVIKYYPHQLMLNVYEVSLVMRCFIAASPGIFQKLLNH